MLGTRAEKRTMETNSSSEASRGPGSQSSISLYSSEVGHSSSSVYSSSVGVSDLFWPVFDFRNDATDADAAPRHESARNVPDAESRRDTGSSFSTFTFGCSREDTLSNLEDHPTAVHHLDSLPPFLQNPAVIIRQSRRQRGYITSGCES